MYLLEEDQEELIIYIDDVTGKQYTYDKENNKFVEVEVHFTQDQGDGSFDTGEEDDSSEDESNYTNSQEDDEEDSAEDRNGEDAEGEEDDEDIDDIKDEDQSSNSNPLGNKGKKSDRDKEEQERKAQWEKEQREQGKSDEEIEAEYQKDKEEESERIGNIKKAFDKAQEEDSISRENKIVKYKERQSQQKRDQVRQARDPLALFKNDLYNFISNQIEYLRGGTWKRPNKKYEDSDIIKRGITYSAENKIPSINIYIDQSHSWDDRDITKSKYLVEGLNKFVKEGLIALNYFYFSNNVHTSAQSARNEGGTEGQPILDHIEEDEPTNVIILTDGDIWDCSSKVSISGAVWLLFKNGVESQNLIDHISGRARTRIYDIDFSDIEL